MQKLHMFLSFPGSSFFPGCVLLSAKQTDHPFRGPSCPKTGWERTNTQENSQVWSIVFGVILSSLGLVNANCGFPLHEMVTWRWNTRMIVGKHGKLTVSGTILSTVQVRMLGHSLWTQAQWQTSIKTDRTKLSAVPLWIPNMSSWCTSWCPFGKDQSKKNLWLGTPSWWTWIVHANGDAMTPVTFPGTPWGAPPDPTWFFSTWFSYTKLPIQHPRSNGSGDWRHLRCLTPRPETFFGNPTGEMGCRVNYQLVVILDRGHLNLHPNPMDYKSYMYMYIHIYHFPIENMRFWGMYPISTHCAE